MDEAQYVLHDEEERKTQLDVEKKLQLYKRVSRN